MVSEESSKAQESLDLNANLKQEFAIICKGLHKTFKAEIFKKSIKTLNGVTFTILKNESFGVVGLNGAGKSTTIKIVLGLLFPDEGEVRVLGGNPADYLVRTRVSYLPENPSFYENLTGEEFLGFIARLRGFAGKGAKDEVYRWLRRVGLESDGNKPLKKYSRGMIQRIGLAQAFLGNPELIILDEPLNGLDPLGRKMARDLIKEAISSGATVFFTSHILEDIEKICDRVAILHKGRILKFIDLKELKGDLEEEFVRTIDEYEKNN